MIASLNRDDIKPAVLVGSAIIWDMKKHRFKV